jgi:hypothetical protein
MARSQNRWPNSSSRTRSHSLADSEKNSCDFERRLRSTPFRRWTSCSAAGDAAIASRTASQSRRATLPSASALV